MNRNFSVHRVKVYKLNAEGQWEDKGTGHISVEYMEVRTAAERVLDRALQRSSPTLQMQHNLPNSTFNLTIALRK